MTQILKPEMIDIEMKKGKSKKEQQKIGEDMYENIRKNKTV